jgi:hypothetical protein
MPPRPRRSDEMTTRLAPNEKRIALEKIRWTAPDEVKVEGPDGKTLVYRDGEAIEWTAAAG